MSNIGMMDGAFFVGRKEIVDWVNHTLQINIAKVEQTCSGAIACQLLDIMHPDQVPMHKVNWGAKQEVEYINNYKVLQTCFTKLKIDRMVDVDRLIKGKYQDNLEFMQWFKRFFEMGSQDNEGYDCAARRARGKGGTQFNASSLGSPSGPAGVATSKPRSKMTAPATRTTRPATKAASTSEKENASSTVPPAPPAPRSRSGSATVSPPAAPSSDNAEKLALANKEIAHLCTEVDRLNTTHVELKVEMAGIEKEREFYFDKLREIEMMLQDLEDNGNGNELTASIFEILYATAEGFQPVDDVDGEEAVTEDLPDTAADDEDLETY